MDEVGVGQAPTTLVLIYTMACPLKCDFCCHPVEDYGPVKIAKQHAIDWIFQAASIPDIDLVVFTGGEPFLYHQELVEVLEATQSTGMPSRIVTAAHWAPTVEDALEKLRPLAERGLAELSISTDPSHQEFVPASYAENAAKACLELGLVCEFAGVFWDPKQCIEDTIDVPAGALTVRGLVSPVGRAAKHSFSTSFYGIDHNTFRGCGTADVWEVTVYADGEVYPCCSGGFNIEGKLSSGNLYREPLDVVFARMKGDLFARLVIDVGMYPIYQLAELKFPEVFAQLPDYSEMVSVCQVCAAVHKDDALVRTLEPVLEYLARLLEVIETIDGSRRSTPVEPVARVLS